MSTTQTYNRIFNKQKLYIPIIKIDKNLYFLSKDTQFQTSTRVNRPERYSLEKLKNNKQKLNYFKNLNENWNSYNGAKIDESIISKIEGILPNLDYQPQIFPTGRGTIQFEKYIDDDNFIEIEISKNSIFVYQVKNGIETERVINEDEINTLISDLYE